MPKHTNEELFAMCLEYGKKARLWRRKFIGLLPEVFKRKLFAQKGFASIFEFAAKLGGISNDQVRLALNLEKRFSNQPILQNLLISGEVSINKLARVVSIATPENEADLSEKIRLLPNRALEVLIRDEKMERSATEKFNSTDQLQTGIHKNDNGLQKGIFEGKSLHVQTVPSPNCPLAFELSPELIDELNTLHHKGINVNELLKSLLQKRKSEIVVQKIEIAQEIQKKAKQSHAKTIKSSTSRYIPIKIKKILQEEFGTKCSITTCPKPSQTTHHTQRFSLARSHDPHFLAPLCAEHHLIAHTVDLKFHQVRSSYFNGS